MGDERVIMQAIAEGDVRARFATSPRRWALASFGVVCVVAGVVGIAVPGMPTTVFLIVASWCFLRSCPWLETKLRENRVLGPYMKYVGPGAVMPRRARVAATLFLWSGVVLSVGLLLWRGGDAGGYWMEGLVLALASVGTVVIWMYGRAPTEIGEARA